MKTTATKEIVLAAIEKVNNDHGYKLELNRADYTGRYFNFTLKTKSGIPGAKISYSGRNVPAASWHAHGFVMNAIFELKPDAVIVSLGKRLHAGFQWEDFNVGSRMFPMYASECSIL